MPDIIQAMNSSLFTIKKFDFLISLYIFCILVSEIMGGKVFSILSVGSFHLNGSVAIFVLPVIFAITDVVTEVFGANRTRSIIRSGFIMIFLLFLTSLLFTHLPPSVRFKPNEKAYDQIFGITARISAASLISFAVSELIDVLVFVKIRQKMGKKALWFRNITANVISEFFDTTLFITLAFYAFDKSFAINYPFLVSLILPYWFLKCFMSVIETPLVYIGVNWLKHEKE